MLKRQPCSIVFIVIWIAAYIADEVFGLMPMLSGNGIFMLNGEYHRLFTGVLMHGNALHLLVNVLAMYYVGLFLEKEIGSLRFALFGLGAAVIAQLAYLSIFPNIDKVFGGSILMYTYFGLILATQLFDKSFKRLSMRTGSGRFIVLCAILGNIPVFSFMNWYTVAIHAVSLTVGFIIGSFAVLAIKKGKRENVQ